MQKGCHKVARANFDKPIYLIWITKKARPNLAFLLAWCTRKDIYKLKIIATAMVRKEGVIEALKAADKMEWVRLMNSICGRADGCADLRENFRLDAACN